MDRVANRLAYKFKFGYYDVDDMKQEARLEAWKGLEKYDGKRPLENFLYVHVHNRLFNLKRDKYARPDKPCHNCPLNAYIPETDECTAYSDILECKWYAGWVSRNAAKKNIINTIEYEGVKMDNEDSMMLSDDVEMIEYKELVRIIEEHLPIELRHDWLRIKSGIKVPKAKRSKLKNTIIQILQEKDIDAEETW